MDCRAFATPKGLRPRERVEPAMTKPGLAASTQRRQRERLRSDPALLLLL
jgi:hypothetical protein